MNGFECFAMMYLNDWHQSDKSLHNAIASTNKSEQLRAFNNAAKYYKISRNFVKLDSEERLAGALDLLNSIRGPVTDENVVETVESLASAFQSKYRIFALSAASKFLWLKFRSPIVIIDGRAQRRLREIGHSAALKGTKYSEYRRQWLAAFHERENLINSACIKLPSVADFSFAYNEPRQDLVSICASRWFRERVFDKYLWY